MTTSPRFDRLAELAGVESDYWDIWGNHHRVDDAGRARILAALGYPADSEPAVAASLARLEEAPWRRLLPPVAVVTVDAPAAVLITLPAAALGHTIRCRITEEDGRVHPLSFRPGADEVAGRADIDGVALVQVALALPERLPVGYHRFAAVDPVEGEMPLIVCPPRCYLPPALAEGGRVWGLAAQLYSLRRAGNWGIGDFTDLAQAIDVTADLGADVFGLNPLHALFTDRPDWASPYAPSSRLFLNPLYIDVEAVPEFATCPEAQTLVRHAADSLERLRRERYVPYAEVSPFKLKVLYALYEWFVRPGRHDHGHAERQQQFERFCEEGGTELARFALFNVIAELHPGVPWPAWPEPLRRPDTAACQAFAVEHAARIEFHMYLQWNADRQLGEAAAAAQGGGMGVGLYVDLAVGAAREGADAWGNPDVIVQAAKVGCPPDPFNMLGQDWGIPPLHPHLLRDHAYAPFIAMLRANMRHAGALRIDHVMGLMHLFWIPADGKPANGAYVQYPFEDLLSLVALESQRARCLVVGEDLGTVPDGFRERMVEANILSYRVLYFERAGDRYKRPSEYPPLSLACVSTHDLATLWGYWQGADIHLKQALDQYPSAKAVEVEKGARVHDRYLLLKALAAEGLLPAGRDPDNVDGLPMDSRLAAALHTYLARSPAQILLVQIDDLMEEDEQINLPGTDTERPNWRRKLSKPVEDLPGMPTTRTLEPALRLREGTPPSR